MAFRTVAALAVVLSILALISCGPLKSPTATAQPFPTKLVPPTIAVDVLAVDARVKFPVLGGGKQTLYATVTLDGRPVQGARVGIVVRYQTVERAIKDSPTQYDGTTSISWSVGAASSGFTVVEVTAWYRGKTARTTTGFSAP